MSDSNILSNNIMPYSIVNCFLQSFWMISVISFDFVSVCTRSWWWRMFLIFLPPDVMVERVFLLHYSDVIMGAMTTEFPAQRANYVENVSIWWRHHESWISPTEKSTSEALVITTLPFKIICYWNSIAASTHGHDNSYQSHHIIVTVMSCENICNVPFLGISRWVYAWYIGTW